MSPPVDDDAVTSCRRCGVQDRRGAERRLRRRRGRLCPAWGLFRPRRRCGAGRPAHDREALRATVTPRAAVSSAVSSSVTTDGDSVPPLAIWVRQVGAHPGSEGVDHGVGTVHLLAADETGIVGRRTRPVLRRRALALLCRRQVGAQTLHRVLHALSHLARDQAHESVSPASMPARSPSRAASSALRHR